MFFNIRIYFTGSVNANICMQNESSKRTDRTVPICEDFIVPYSRLGWD
jgi:hypothetical protein